MVKARSPTLDTLLMIEKHMKENNGTYRKKELWQSLPKKMMYQTFCVAINYLQESRKIAVDSVGVYGWVWYPEFKLEGTVPLHVVERRIREREAREKIRKAAARRSSR